MILRSINSRRKDSGFTIVELLVVIVVIAILAAITIVSYTGITKRANASTAQSNANSVESVVNMYAVDSANNGFPSLENLTAYNGYSKIPTGLTVSAGGVGALSGSNGTNTILYLNKGTTGACIGWWDYNSGAGVIAYKYAGDAKAASLLIASPTCT